jgi:hypothetical protein
VAPRLAAGAVVAVAPLVGAAVRGAAVAPRPEVAEAAVGPQPAGRAAEAAHRQ